MCWTLLYLDIHQEWREKCKKEIKDFLSRQLGDSFAVTPDKLSAIPLSAWEDEVPTLDACIRETQRLVLTGIAFRRNLREGAILCGKVVNQGDFFTYRASEAHLNPEYYPEPHKYDPGRWLRPDPVPDTPFPFVGWGAGRHPCPGQKIAKLELKWILVPFLTRYEYELVNEDGKLPNPLPVPNNGCPRVRIDCGDFFFRPRADSAPRVVLSERLVTSRLRRFRSRRIACDTSFSDLSTPFPTFISFCISSIHPITTCIEIHMPCFLFLFE